MGDLTENFSEYEFECSCGCECGNISPRLVGKLQVAREALGKPMSITSGVRCADHNKKVGGSKTSSHLAGNATAADIAWSGNTHLFELVRALMGAGFRRIGINYEKHFVHVDVDLAKPSPRLFKYPQKTKN